MWLGNVSCYSRSTNSSQSLAEVRIPAGDLLTEPDCSPALTKTKVFLEGQNCFAHTSPMLIALAMVLRTWSCLHQYRPSPSAVVQCHVLGFVFLTFFHVLGLYYIKSLVLPSFFPQSLLPHHPHHLFHSQLHSVTNHLPSVFSFQVPSCQCKILTVITAHVLSCQVLPHVFSQP